MLMNMHESTLVIDESKLEYLPAITTAKLAMWLFLGTEIMFFSGLLGAYIVLRFGAPYWPRPHDVHLVEWMGAFNTFVLICSSVSVVLAHKALTDGDTSKAVSNIFITFVLGFVFLGVKAVEYKAKWDHNILPGHVAEFVDAKYLETVKKDTLAKMLGVRTRVEEQEKVLGELKEFIARAESGDASIVENNLTAQALGHRVAENYPGIEMPQLIPNGNLWASFYFTLTGIHATHVIGGLVMFALMLIQAARGKFGIAQETMVENAGLYWHFVDIVWIFLFPLLYLIG
jgi:cytochrome c oxidase subunit 3